MKIDFKQAVTQHTPEILIGLGIAGFVGTVIFAVKTTPKAEKLIDEAKAETFPEKAKATWKAWWPVAALGAASAGSIICGTVKFHKKNVALMTLCAATETAFSNYRNIVLDKVDPEKVAEIKTDFQEHMKESKMKDVVEDKEVYELLKPEILCREEYTGRYFMGRRADVEKLCVELGHELNTSFSTMEYNEFLQGVGLSPSEAGSGAGWTSGDRLEPWFSWGEAPDGGPLLEVGFYKGPSVDFRETW